MLLPDLIADCNESIRVHHASGHFATDEATARLIANGLNPDEAAQLLAQPVDEALFVQYRTWPKDGV